MTLLRFFFILFYNPHFKFSTALIIFCRLSIKHMLNPLTRGPANATVHEVFRSISFDSAKT